MVAVYSEKVIIWLSIATAPGDLYHLADTMNVRSHSKYVDMDSQCLQFVDVVFGQVRSDT